MRAYVTIGTVLRDVSSSPIGNIVLFLLPILGCVCLKLFYNLAARPFESLLTVEEQLFPQHLKLEIGTSRKTEALVAVRKWLAFSGPIVAPAFIPREELGALHDDGHVHRVRRPAFDRPTFGGFNQLSANSSALHGRPDCQHPQITRLPGAFEVNAADKEATVLIQQDDAARAGDRLGDSLDVDSLSAEEIRLRRPSALLLSPRNAELTRAASAGASSTVAGLVAKSVAIRPSLSRRAQPSDLTVLDMQGEAVRLVPYWVDEKRAHPYALGRNHRRRSGIDYRAADVVVVHRARRVAERRTDSGGRADSRSGALRDVTTVVGQAIGGFIGAILGLMLSLTFGRKRAVPSS